MSMMINSARFGTAAGLYGNHAYWRVFCSDNWGDGTGINLAEVEFLDAAGSTITATGGTAVKSDDSTGNEASKAFDGNASTVWYADSAPTNQWVGYHYSSAVPAEQVRLTNYTQNARTPKNCKLEYSDDGSSWTTAFTFVNVNASGAVQTYPEAPPGAGFHKLWRIFVVAASGAAGNIDEVEFRATSGGADQVAAQTSDAGNSSGHVVFSTSPVSNEAWRAFDNTTGSWFASTAANSYIGFLFVTAVKVEEILIKGGSTASRSPTSLRVEYSDDGTTWTSQKSISSLTWSASETKVLAAI